VKKAQLNLIDKAVAFLNPQGAVDRMIARQKLVNFSYDAVKYTRERKGPSALSGAEDYHSNYDRVELMKRARDLAENVGLVRSILMKFASHTAANISYQARTENPEVNTEVEAYWAEWFDKCDITTRHTGSTLMQVAMMSMLRDGDFLFCLVRDKDANLKIQGIEADRLGDPFKVYTSLDLIGGIHIDRDTGAPSAYDIYSRSIGDFYTYQTTIPSSQAFHLFDPLRIDQYRGISAFHTAINDCTDIYDIINFEKMAAKNASSQAGIVKRNNNNASDLSSLTNDEDLNGNTIKLEAIESGKISYLEPGEDIVFPDGPSRPSGAFAEFHKILLRNICLGLGIPYSFAVDPSAMSGPTARLEMQQAGRTFRRYQKLLDDKVLRPIKNIVIADGVARGLIEDNVGSRTTRGIFNFGANVSIDLGRESQANLAEFRSGLMTASQIYSERGLDFESSMRQRAIEAKLIKDLAEEYQVSADTISDIAAEGLTRDSQQAQATTPEGEQTPAGQPSDEDMLGGASLNGAQVASLINVINAVAMGAVSKEGAVSIITAAFPTISPDQARAIIAGVNVGTTIPTTKEEKQQIGKDQGGDASGGSTPPAPEPTTPPTAPAGTSQKKSSLEVLESLDPASIKMLIEGMMGGIELAKYDGIDFTPPQGARDAAKRALDVREGKPSSQRGMTPVGIARARDLMNGVKLSPDTARRMKAFFDRHEVDKKGATFGEQGKGWQAWNGWGGDAGYAWARKVVGQMEAREKKTEFVAGRDCGQDDGGTFGPDNKCAVGYGRPPIKGGYTPTRPGGKFPKGYKRPTPQVGKGKKPLPPKPPAPKPPATKPPVPPPPPPPPAGTKKPTEEKPAKKSKFPNATKAYDSKEKASLEPVIKENQKQLQTVRDKIIKGSSAAQKDVESQENKYQETKKNLSETQQKFSELAKRQDEVAATDPKKYEEYKARIERDYSKLQSLREELRAQKQIVENSRAKVREIGLKAIREDMLEINKQDGFSSQQLSKATEELKQKQKTAIATDKKSIRDSKDANAAQQREKAQDALRSIFNPNTHDESLSKPITYSAASRAHSVGRTIEFVDGTRSANLTGIVINKETSLSTILHEYGHQVENGSPEAHDLCSDFLKKRTSGEKVERYQRVFKGYGYGKEEEGSPDDFEKTFKAVAPEADTKNKAYYAGKRYKETPFGASSKSLASTEVYSMGLELLHENPVAFAQADPEWFDLVSGIATGRLLKKTRGLK
jgi:lambda family phage portal protein